MQTIDISIDIEAPASAVWRVFTEPEITRRMGGEYVSEWRPGAAFGWKNLEGEMLTNGRITDIQPGLLLRHELYAGATPIVTSTITYRLTEEDDITTLIAIEELRRPLGDEEYAEAVDGWKAALRSVKELAEKL